MRGIAAAIVGFTLLPLSIIAMLMMGVGAIILAMSIPFGLAGGLPAFIAFAPKGAILFAVGGTMWLLKMKLLRFIAG